MIDDDLVWPHIDGLLSSVTETVEQRGLPGFCYADIVPGVQAALEYCAGNGCGGMLWVRLAQVFPSTNFDSSAGFEKGAPYKLHGFELELGIVRAMPVATRTGQPPTKEQMREAARLQLADMKALRLGAARFFKNSDLDYTPSGYIPTSGGACTGGYWQLRVRQDF